MKEECDTTHKERKREEREVRRSEQMWGYSVSLVVNKKEEKGEGWVNIIIMAHYIKL